MEVSPFRGHCWWKFTLRIWVWHRPLPCCWLKRINKYCVVNMNLGEWSEVAGMIDVPLATYRHHIYMYIHMYFFACLQICCWLWYYKIGVSPLKMTKFLWGIWSTNSPRQVLISLITLRLCVALQHFFLRGGGGSESSFIIMNDLGFGMCLAEEEKLSNMSYHLGMAPSQ